MADQTVPTPYPNTGATTDGALPADRQPPHTQQTHPSTTADAEAPQVRHAEDHDDEAGNRGLRER